MRALLPIVTLISLAAPVSAKGVDRAALAALEKRAGELDTDALVVMKDGRVVLERWYDGAAPNSGNVCANAGLVSAAST